MALQTYTVYYSTDYTIWTALTNVQNININVGRQAQLQQLKASTASFSLRYPNGYASPITDLVSGTYIRIDHEKSNGTQFPTTLWTGIINNVDVSYGIPYVSNVGNGDFLDVSCEGSFAQLARMNANNYAMPAGTIATQYDLAEIENGISVEWLGNGAAPASPATTISSTWGDWVNRIALTGNMRMWDSKQALLCYTLSPFDPYLSDINFSDVANNSTNQVYERIDFGSFADNYYTQVRVQPEGLTTQTVTQVGATTPYRTYEVNTLNASNAQALDYANYLLNNYDTANFAITAITCKAESQASFQLDRVGFTAADAPFSCAMGSQVSVAFRGTTFQCIIEGAVMSATPAGSTYTYYVSGADLNAYLILDNLVFGKLDNNKLGY